MAGNEICPRHWCRYRVFINEIRIEWMIVDLKENFLENRQFLASHTIKPFGRNNDFSIILRLFPKGDGENTRCTSLHILANERNHFVHPWKYLACILKYGRKLGWAIKESERAQGVCVRMSELTYQHCVFNEDQHPAAFDVLTVRVKLRPDMTAGFVHRDITEIGQLTFFDEINKLLVIRDFGEFANTGGTIWSIFEALYPCDGSREIYELPGDVEYHIIVKILKYFHKEGGSWSFRPEQLSGFDEQKALAMLKNADRFRLYPAVGYERRYKLYLQQQENWPMGNASPEFGMMNRALNRSVVDICEQYIWNHVRAENFVDIQFIAVNYKLENLLQNCIDLINYWTTVRSESENNGLLLEPFPY